MCSKVFFNTPLCSLLDFGCDSDKIAPLFDLYLFAFLFLAMQPFQSQVKCKMCYKNF